MWGFPLFFPYCNCVFITPHSTFTVFITNTAHKDMHFIHPHHIKSVYTLCKLHILLCCGSLPGQPERMGENPHFWFSRLPSLLNTQNYNDARLDLDRLQFPELSFDPGRKSHSSVMYKNFVWPFIHYSEADRCLASERTCVWNMWRAAPVCVDGDNVHRRQIWLLDERRFLSFCYSPAFRSLYSFHRAITASVVCEAEPLDDRCFWGMLPQRTRVHRHGMWTQNETPLLKNRSRCSARKHPHPSDVGYNWNKMSPEWVSLARTCAVGPRGSAYGSGDGSGAIVV